MQGCPYPLMVIRGVLANDIPACRDPQARYWGRKLQGGIITKVIAGLHGQFSTSERGADAIAPVASDHSVGDSGAISIGDQTADHRIPVCRFRHWRWR